MSASFSAGGLSRGITSTRTLLSTTTSSFSFRPAQQGGGGGDASFRRPDGRENSRTGTGCRDDTDGTTSQPSLLGGGRRHHDVRIGQNRSREDSSQHRSGHHSQIQYHKEDHRRTPQRTQEYYRAVEALRKSKEQQKKVNYNRQFIASASEEAKVHFKREQKSRIEAFLYDLRDQARGHRLNEQGVVESQWEVAVEAIQHAASCGAPISSDMIGEAIDLCGREKQFVQAEKLFYGLHHSYQIHRGAAATKAFFKVCEATGNFAAAHRLIVWTAEQLEIREKARRDIDEGVHLLATTSDDTLLGSPSPSMNDGGKKNGVASTNSKGKSSSSPPPPLSSDVFTSYLRSISNTGSQKYFGQNWVTALSFYTTKRFHPVHAPKCATTADLLDSIIQVQARAADWVGAVSTFRRALVLLTQGKAGSAASSPSSLSYVYDNTVDLVLSTAFKAKRHFEVVRTLQCAARLSTTSVKPKGFKPSSSAVEEEEDIGWSERGVDVPAGGGGGYIPDEAAARMGIFSAEEVTATTYELLLGTNIPALMQERAYLEYTNSTFGKILQRDREMAQQKGTTSANTLVPSLQRSNAGPSPLNPTPYDAASVSLSQSDLDNRKAAWELSIQLFRGLADGGYPLFPQTYESPIRACIMAGKWEHAARMVMELKRDERPIPQQYIYSILCESIAHNPRPNLGLNAIRSHPLLADYARVSSLPYIAAMRQAMALGKRVQFLRASGDMRAANHSDSHLKSKLMVDFGASPITGNWLQALASFSRMSNLRNIETTRLQSTSNFTTYPVLAGVSGHSADALVVRQQAATKESTSSYVDHALAFSPVMLLRLEGVGQMYLAQQLHNKERALAAVRQREENKKSEHQSYKMNEAAAEETEEEVSNKQMEDVETKPEESSSIIERINNIPTRDTQRSVEWDARKEENLELARVALQEVRSLLYGNQNLHEGPKKKVFRK